ncbi:MAG: hypothetical protein C0594_01620, partial [Marinilabiliales bacterium]
RILLTRSTSYFYDEQPPRETGATVSLSTNDTIVFLNESAPGIYSTDRYFAGEIGKTYTLTIVTTDGEEYTSQSTIKHVARLDYVLAYYMPNSMYPYFGEPGFYNLKLFAQEPEGAGDNYMFKVYLEDETGRMQLHNDTLIEQLFATTSDEGFDGMYLPGVDFYSFNQSEIKRDTTYGKVEMLSIPKEFLDYGYAAISEIFQGGMFGTIPANVPTNISNGGLGFFYASDITTHDFIIVKEH